MVRHFLRLLDYSGEEIRELIELAKEMKKNPEKFKDSMNNKNLAMIFDKTSTRTRISFEAGMTQLGGHGIFIDKSTTNMHKGAVEEEATCISRYCEQIMARVSKQEILDTMAKASEVPVMNAMTNEWHPCQALADVMVIEEHKGNIKDLTVGYVGDGANVVNSLIVAIAKLGGKIKVGTPEGYEPSKEAVDFAKEKNAIELTNNPAEALKDVDVVITDTWVSLGQEEEKEKRMKVFPAFKVDSELVKNAKPDYIFLHCLPAQIDYEVTEQILRGEHSVIFDEAENRMHTEKALIYWLEKTK